MRRPGRSRRLGAKVPETTPLTILGASSVALWLRADKSVATSGSDVTDWLDQSGNGNDASEGSINPQYVNPDADGKPSISWVNRNDNLTVSDDATLRPSAISVSFWVNLEAVSASTRQFIFGNGSSQRRFFVRIPTNTRKLEFRVFKTNATFGDGLTTNDVLTVGTWHHVSVTYDPTQSSGSRINMYVDGSTVAHSDGALDAINQTAGEDIYIGTDVGTDVGTGLNGELDDIVIANRAITSEEVTSLSTYRTRG